MKTRPHIKICGIKNTNTAISIAKEGADFVGLVFHPNSPRNIEIEESKKIVDSLSKTKTLVVGVFVDQNASEISSICNYTGINIAQLHGKNARESLSKLPKEIRKIFTIEVDYSGKIDNTEPVIIPYLNNEKDFLLFDGKEPGSGKSFNVKKDVFNAYDAFRCFIAGGINNHNVKNIILTLNPYAIDVSSSLEKEKGVKDINLIKEFINNLKNE